MELRSGMRMALHHLSEQIVTPESILRRLCYVKRLTIGKGAHDEVTKLEQGTAELSEGFLKVPRDMSISYQSKAKLEDFVDLFKALDLGDGGRCWGSSNEGAGEEMLP